MNNPMLVGHLTTGRTGPIQGHRPSDRNRQTNSDGVSFQELLSQQQLKFSHHAEQRLQQRGIQLQPDQLERIASAVDQAAALEYVRLVAKDGGTSGHWTRETPGTLHAADPEHERGCPARAPLRDLRSGAFPVPLCGYRPASNRQ